MQKFNGKVISLKFTAEQLDEVERISKRLGIKRSEMIRNLMDVGISVFHGYEKVGIVKVHEIQKRAMKTIKKELQPSLFDK